MPTAPSFADFRKITETPFLKNGKLYITVEHPNTLNHRDVRWYSDEEYTKLYGNKEKKKEEKGLPSFNYKIARGFANGPILVIRNEKLSDEQWLKESNARFALGVGWYIASTDTLPLDAPAHFKYLLLPWEECGSPDGSRIKSNDEIASILKAKARNNEYINFSTQTVA